MRRWGSSAVKVLGGVVGRCRCCSSNRASFVKLGQPGAAAMAGNVGKMGDC